MPSDADGGYIRVGVRVRPPIRADETLDDTMVVNEQEGAISLQIAVSLKQEAFHFASVYQSQDNAELFEAVGAPLLRSAIDGYNGTLLTYGQTGSGKTYTMGEVSRIGTEHEGMSHRMVRGLFEAAERDGSHKYEISMQFVQIHLEKVFDLLGEKPQNRDPKDLAQASEVALSLREDKAKGTVIQGCVWRSVASLEEALALMTQACSRLAFASTMMNKHSSRSHALCTLHVARTTALAAETNQPLSPGLAASGEGAEHTRREALKSVLDDAPVKHKLTQGKLTLVDLAGSEDVGRSGVVGEALAEAKKINSSLLALGNVIHVLTHTPPRGGRHGAVHVPFRSSVLTRLLSDSIGGNCRTAILCCCSPAKGDVTETISTLRFGARAKLVRNHARVNATLNVSSLAEELQVQLDASAQMLESSRKLHEQSAARALVLALKLRAMQQRLAEEKAAAVEAAVAAAKEQWIREAEEARPRAQPPEEESGEGTAVERAVAAALAKAQEEKEEAVREAVAAAVAEAREEAERDKEQALTKASERAAYLQAAALEAANELHLCRAGGGNGGVWRSPWRGSRRALADLS